MTSESAQGVHLSDSCLESIVKLPSSVQSRIPEVIRGLAGYIKEYPDRIWYDPMNRVSVYTHPDPALEITYQVDEHAGSLSCSQIVQPFSPRVTVFVSYSHQDMRLFEEVRKYFSTLDEQGKISFWHDRKIDEGADWESTLLRALHSAKAAVLLVSQDFLTSTYIKETELPVLKESVETRDVRVYWIPLRHSLYKEFWFSALQALGDPEKPLADLNKSKREKRLTEISLQLKRKLSELTK